jgi:hypothetical protein
LIALDVPVIEAVTVSAAMTTWEPAVLMVALKLPVPFVNVEFAGRDAWLSLLVNEMVPE